MNTIRDEAADQARWSDLNYIINSSGVTFDNFLFASVPGFYKKCHFQPAWSFEPDRIQR